MVVTPKLIVEVNITGSDSPATTIKEGDTLTELKYMVDGSEVTTTGKITVINFNYVRPTTTATCIHDTTSTFATAITPTTMIVDCSTEFASDVREVPFTSITSLIVQSE